MTDDEPATAQYLADLPSVIELDEHLQLFDWVRDVIDEAACWLHDAAVSP